MISLREGRTGVPLLEFFGVPSDRIFVTGDDAIELAYERRCSSMGDAIGINMRIAEYAGSDEDTIRWIREPLMRSVYALNSFLVPVIIAFREGQDSGAESLGKLLEGQSDCSPAAVESPEEVIDLIGKCRVMVTCSYHGAVFALAQGIPVVGLLQSKYYEQKFTGLQEQFPGGCRTIDFRRPVSSGEIEDAIRGAWESAEHVRDSLLEAAVRQIELSRAAYRTAKKLCPLESQE
jgi:colanic acid/amylovoran biosynthesis protein